MAETYLSSRAYHPESTTFVGLSTTGEEEGQEDTEEESDLDVGDIDSDTTSASEGSEDIEPFPLPPAPPPEFVSATETRRTSSQHKRCSQELHEVIEEMEVATVTEVPLFEDSVPLKFESPVRLSQAYVAEQLELASCSISEGEIKEKSSFKKPRNRRRSAKRRQRSVPDTNPPTGDTEEV